MLDLTVIILTYNEELHIGRCLERLGSLARRIVVVDSMSTDRTCEIATSMGADVVAHQWPGNQAEQFNWALDNIAIDTQWILRLDADEYLLPELVDELQERVPLLPDDITGVTLRRRHIFMGKWVKHGVYPVKLLRMFRRGCARYEERLMDEHLLLSKGCAVEMKHDFCDHNLNDLAWFCRKHIDYSLRESAEMLKEQSSDTDVRLDGQARDKRRKKGRYSRLPLFWRSTAYFLYRYILRGGFLDGTPGFLFAFIQAWWYRTLVDAHVYVTKKRTK